MKKALISFGVLVFFLANILSAQENSNKGVTPKFDEKRNPFKDLKTAIADAKKSNKRIILDVGGEWCIWCRRLDGFLEEHTELFKYMHNNFVVVKVNYSEKNKNEKFLSQYPKILGYPHLFVLEKNGKFLYSKNTGELEEEKSYNEEKIMMFLKEWTLKKER